MKMAPYMLKLATMLVVSSCCLSKTCASASPVPPYTAYRPQATERSAVTGVLNEEARFEPSNSGSGSRPTIANRDQLITDERPTPTIPQAKQQLHQGYTTATPSSNDAGIGPGPATVEPSTLPQLAEVVLAPMGSCDWVVLKEMASLVADGASTTGGTALPAGTTITSDVVGTFSTIPGDITTGERPSLVPFPGSLFPRGPHPRDSPPPDFGPSPSTSSSSPTTSSLSSFTPLNIAVVSGNDVGMPPVAVAVDDEHIGDRQGSLGGRIKRVESGVALCGHIQGAQLGVTARKLQGAQRAARPPES
ncbi:hypothetical protein EDB83DRAFT_2561618 [Lactarius deliciosus]|nr:hypothetical protein EDB83DRAFT_2561618 [Lactarius deliciosus]